MRAARIRVRTQSAPAWRVWGRSDGDVEAFLQTAAVKLQGSAPTSAATSDRWCRETDDIPYCAICKSGAMHREEWVTLPCQHSFHSGCLRRMRAAASGSGGCPHCQCPLCQACSPWSCLVSGRDRWISCADDHGDCRARGITAVVIVTGSSLITTMLGLFSQCSNYKLG